MLNKKSSSAATDYSTELIVTHLNNAVVACTRWVELDRSNSRLLKMRNVVEGLMGIMRETQAVDEMKALDQPPLFSVPEIVMVLQAASLFFLVEHLEPNDPLRKKASLGMTSLPGGKES